MGASSLGGKLAAEIATEENETEAPLKQKLQRLADVIAKASYLGSTLIAVVFMFKQIVLDNGWQYQQIVTYCSNLPVLLHDTVTTFAVWVLFYLELA